MNLTIYTFEQALERKLFLESVVDNLSKEGHQKFPERGPMGLTPDHIKATPEWKAHRSAFDSAMRQQRVFGTWFLKQFKKEYAAHRKTLPRGR